MGLFLKKIQYTEKDIARLVSENETMRAKYEKHFVKALGYLRKIREMKNDLDQYARQNNFSPNGQPIIIRQIIFDANDAFYWMNGAYARFSSPGTGLPAGVIDIISNCKARGITVNEQTKEIWVNEKLSDSDLDCIQNEILCFCRGLNIASPNIIKLREEARKNYPVVGRPIDDFNLQQDSPEEKQQHLIKARKNSGYQALFWHKRIDNNEPFPILCASKVVQQVPVSVRKYGALLEKVGLLPKDSRRSFIIVDDVLYGQDMNYTEGWENDGKVAAFRYDPSLDSVVDKDRFRWLLGKTIMENALSLKPYGVVFLDFDGFKKINDTYGHINADNLMKEVARRLAKMHSKQRGDVFGRYGGGDEFIFLFNNLANSENSFPEQMIEAKVQQLKKIFLEPFIIRHQGVDEELRLFFSMGIHICYPRPVLSGASLTPQELELKVDDLINKADQNLLRAKSQNKGGYILTTDNDDFTIQPD